MLSELEALETSDEFTRLKADFGGFCPFEALGVTRSETRHSNFLAYYLNPRAAHGCGTLMLEALLRSVGRTPADDMQAAEIEREHAHIDILIRLPKAKVGIAIELKIDAEEHGDQLRRYRDYALSKWSELRWDFIFLTKNGAWPSDEHGVGWQALALDVLVAELERSNVSIPPGAGGTFLAAYLKMMRRNHLSNKPEETLASKLWREHRAALEYLVEQKPDLASELLRRQAELVDLLSKCTKLTVVADGWSRKKDRLIIRFAVEEWDGIVHDPLVDWPNTRGDRLVLLELAVKPDGEIIASMVLGRGDPARRVQIAERLGRELPQASNGREWIILDEESGSASLDLDDNVKRAFDFMSRAPTQFLVKMDRKLRPE